MSKLYICVSDTFPDYMAPTLVAHAVLGYHCQMEEDLLADLDHPFAVEYRDWLYNSFKKVVVRVNQKEYDKIKTLKGFYIKEFRENKTNNGELSCCVLLVHDSVEVPNVLKFAKLWKPLENKGQNDT